MLVLTATSPDGPAPDPLRLDRRGATIGRGPGVDLVLPDARQIVSARHCAIEFRGGEYVLQDTSTNGTRVDGRRLSGPHILRGGEVIGIGTYDLRAALGAPAAAALRPPPSVAPVAGDAAGAMLRAFVTATLTALDARAKARTELGVAGAADAGPFRSGATTEQVLHQLLAERPAAAAAAATGAIEALDGHARAALGAMRGALATTLARVSPAAIRQRAGGSDAACWQAYEAAFADMGDAQFIEVFARELGASYAALTVSPRR